MNIRELEVFVHTCEAGSFAAVAQELFMTRQAVSKAVGLLEAELGPLFARGARGVEPTALGREVYPVAHRMLEDRDRILADARRFAAGRLGALRLACEPGALLTLPAHLTEAYREARPQVNLTTELLSVPHARRHLLDGRADAVVAGPLEVEGVFWRPLLSSSLAIVFSEGAFACEELRRAHPIEGGALTAGVEALDAKTVLGVAPDNHVERSLGPYLTARGITAHITCDYGDSMLGQTEMLRGTGGIIVEEGAAWRQFNRPGHVLVPLTGDDAPRWMVGVTWLNACANAACAEDFAQFARKQVEESESENSW